MTHSELVRLAAKWLAKKHSVVITEMAGQSEEPDGLGFRGAFSTLVECKATRSDFAADKLKSALRMGDKRYYMVPSGLVTVEDCPPDWGLLYASAKRIVMVREAVQMDKKDWRGEQALLISCIRRIGQTTPTGVSVKFYTYQTKNRATLGVENSTTTRD